MKSLTDYILEEKQVDDNLAKKVINAVLMNNADKVKLENVDTELSKYNYDMKIVLAELEAEKPQNKLDNVKEFLNIIWEYIEEHYSNNDADKIYGYISENLYKYTKVQ